jgi:hypothetical protein
MPTVIYGPLWREIFCGFGFDTVTKAGKAIHIQTRFIGLSFL